jgi:hypothetical protein
MRGANMESPTVGHASSSMRRTLARPAYRVWQVWRALTPRQLVDADRAVVNAQLPPAAQQLFAAMSPADQRHSLDVYRALLVRGCCDPDLLAAALLHDCGKGSGRVRFWVRPPVVLLRALAPGLLRWLAAGRSPWWRRPFFHAWHHAAIGADLAAAADMPERAVLYIRTHHQPNGPAAELHALDERM